MLTGSYAKARDVMENKYSRLQISIHWLVFLLVIATCCAMELRGFFPRNDRPLISMVHVFCGISIPVLMVVRLLLELKYLTPPTMPKPESVMTGLAYLEHLVIYLLFVVLPVIGLVTMYSRGNPWFAFGLTMPHASEVNSEQVDSLKSWHETLANLRYFVIGLHAATALAHHYFWEDNTLLCMIPRKHS